MPYKISSLPTCSDCGKTLRSPRATRCQQCWARSPEGGRRPRKRRSNDYRIEENVAYLALTDREGNCVAEAMIDTDQLPRALRFRWAYNSNGYAVTQDRSTGRARALGLHRFVLGIDPGEPIIVDHINRNKLDCRVINLRRADPVINGGNRDKLATSRYPGVCWDPTNERWYAQGGHDGQWYWLGRWSTEEEAFTAYQEWRRSVGLPPVDGAAIAAKRSDDVPRQGREKHVPASHYTGVQFCRQTGRWSARVRRRGKEIWLGRYPTELDAARVIRDWKSGKRDPSQRDIPAA